MNRTLARRFVVLAFLALLAVAHVACTATVGVGVGVPIYGGWGPYGPHPYGGVYVGGPIWP